MITELEFKEPGRAGLQPHPAADRGLRRPRDAAVALPEARLRRWRRQAQLPARIVVGGERFWALFASSACRARCCAQRLRGPKSSPTGRRRDARGQPAGLHRPVPGALQGGAAPGPAALLRRPLAGYFGYDAVRYIEPKLAKTWKTAASPRPTSCCCSARSWRSSTTLGRLYLIVYANPAEPEAYFRPKRRLTELGDKLRYSVTAPGQARAGQQRGARVSQGRLPAAVERSKNTSPPAT